MTDYRLEIIREDGKPVEPRCIELDGQGYFAAIGGSVQGVLLYTPDGSEQIPAVLFGFDVDVDDNEPITIGVVSTVDGAKFFAESINEAVRSAEQELASIAAEAKVIPLPLPLPEPDKEGA